MSALIYRDPFARQELHRETVNTPAGCTWCGQQRKNRKSLFVYYTETDSGHIYYFAGKFCSIGCFRSYHDQPATPRQRRSRHF